MATEAAVAAEAAEVGEAVKAGEAVKEAGLREVVAGGRMQLLCLAMLCFGLGAWMMVGRRVLTLSLRLRLRLRLSLSPNAKQSPTQPNPNPPLASPSVKVGIAL